MQLEKDYRYLPTHEWVKVENNVALVGITDYAQDHLGEIVFVDVPETGKTVAAKGDLAAVESVKGVSDIYAPVSGTIAAVNESLADNPGAINADPFGSWIVKIEMSDPAELDGLLTAEQYEKHCESEAH